ncbi:chemotaxis protein CheW [Geomonas sp. Red69]|uniref:chemotaxis protein CheW n=1 Tax=Geomonas diazotrophica TaxID=2843197 RepID=UPI001C100F83|nr:MULTISPECIES: chemotaxis protein CheW [Geomonas]MBU5637619.1 chemotaxis protein CheW [Geomonas diazotrophica]QXE88431.1 chemotaxis protein CheW [Geomonas nitrogeniifigens]
MPLKSSSIDWALLLKRQEAAFQAAVAPSDDPVREQALLLERARQLSLKKEPAADGTGIDCLEFLLSGERYAIELSYIAATLPLTDFTPLFCAPSFVLGITNLRGRIISIVDLRRFFELPALGLSDLNRVIVVGDERMEFGVLADSIVGTRSVSAADLLPTPDTFAGPREEFVAGVTAERLALLDMGRILADPRMVVHEEVG